MCRVWGIKYYKLHIRTKFESMCVSERSRKLVSRKSDCNHCTCNSFCDTEILSLLIEHNELGMIE